MATVCNAELASRAIKRIKDAGELNKKNRECRGCRYCKKDKAYVYKYKLPEIIPQITVEFKHKGAYTVCLFQIRNKLRIGATVCSKKDEYNAFKGAKVALKRAMDQHKLGKMVRQVYWTEFLLQHEMEVSNSDKACLNWFKSGKVTFNV